MDIFSALADPNRRNIVELLATHGQLSASDISHNFQITPAAISQHLKVLREAHLVRVEKRAQQRLYTIDPAKIHELEEWAKKMAKRLEERFSRLDDLLEQEKSKLRGGGTK